MKIVTFQSQMGRFFKATYSNWPSRYGVNPLGDVLARLWNLSEGLQLKHRRAVIAGSAVLQSCYGALDPSSDIDVWWQVDYLDEPVPYDDLKVLFPGLRDYSFESTCAYIVTAKKRGHPDVGIVATRESPEDTVMGFDLPCIRAWYDGSDLWVTEQFLNLMKDRLIMNVVDHEAERWVLRRTHERIKKYQSRGMRLPKGITLVPYDVGRGKRNRREAIEKGHVGREQHALVPVMAIEWWNYATTALPNGEEAPPPPAPSMISMLSRFIDRTITVGELKRILGWPAGQPATYNGITLEDSCTLEHYGSQTGDLVDHLVGSLSKLGLESQ